MNAILRRALPLVAAGWPFVASAYMLNTTSSGAPIQWPVPRASFEVNAQAAPAGGSAAIQAAMAAWSAVPGADFQFVYAGSTTRSGLSYDGHNVCSFGDLGTDGSLAVNSYWFYSDGTMVESDVLYNTNYLWSVTGAADRFDVQSVAAHELGHALSLADLYGAADAAKTMYAFTVMGQIGMRTLHPDDMAGLVCLYPSLPPAVTLRGTPFSWLYRYELVADDGDEDGDALKTWEEYLVGSDPTSRNTFAIQSFAPGAGHSVVMKWASSTTGATTPYRIEASTNSAAGPWFVLDSVPRTPPTNTWSYVPPGNLLFLKIVVTNRSYGL
jgi:hypothetical protein